MARGGWLIDQDALGSRSSVFAGPPPRRSDLLVQSGYKRTVLAYTSCSIVISYRCTVCRENESSHLSPVLSSSRIDVSSTEAFVERNNQSKCSLFPFFFFFVSFRLILIVSFWRNNWFDREWFNYSSSKSSE